MKLPISVIILTYNEEKNIEACVRSVIDFAESVFIVDSYSTDKTLEIAKKYTDKIFQHEFENYGKQRNWALNNLSINTAWVLHINADQCISGELKNELLKIFSSNIQSDVKGYLIPRKTIFMGRWIRYGGHFPVYDAIFFKKGYGICEKSRYDQLFIINGTVKKINAAVEDFVTDSLSNFILRHNKWSSFEAIDQVLKEDQISNKSGVRQNLLGNPMEQRRYLKSMYMKLPLFIRPFLYWVYRYFILMGFMDGLHGLIFHFLQGFWFRFLVDAKIFEIKLVSKVKNITIDLAIREIYGEKLGS